MAECASLAIAIATVSHLRVLPSNLSRRGHPMADSLPVQVRIGPCDLGHGDDTDEYVVLGGGQGTAAADEASRSKMAQIKWQRCHSPAQRSCHLI